MRVIVHARNWLMATAFVSLYWAPVSADDAVERECSLHAAVIVAEMKAGSARILAATELELVRETARKSCLRQHGAAAAAAPKASMAKPAAPAPRDAAPAQSLAKVRAASAAQPRGQKQSFWDSLAPFLNAEPARKAGNARLRRRGQ
jgi:hypothetical protein